MTNIWTVIKFTIKENIQKKSFIVSTILMMALVVLAFSIPTISKIFLNSETSSKPSSNDLIYVIDEDYVFANDINLLEKTFKDYTFKISTMDVLDSLKGEIKDSLGDSIVVIKSNARIITFDYYVKKSGKGLNPRDLEKELRNIYSNNLLQTLGVPQDVIYKVSSDITYTVNEIGVDSASGLIFGMVISLLLFFSIYLFGYGVAMSVASEKTSRVMELLITSVRPSTIIIGKTIAMGLTGLCQFILVLLTGYLSYEFISAGDLTIGNLQLNPSVITPLVLIMMIIYFIIGYFLYAFMNAVAGATVSKAEDVQSALMPVNMIAMLGFYFAYFTVLMDSSNQLIVIASILPFSSPFSMPIRILTGGVPTWQIFSSLAALILFTTFIAWISIRLYSAAVLHYGNKISFASLFNMSKKN